MRLSTQRVANGCACHPWRTISAWGVLIVLALAATGLLAGDLTTEGKPTGNPESWQAKHAFEKAFPADPETGFTDVAIVRSDRYTVDSPRFETFVAGLMAEARATEAVVSARSWYETGDRSLVSPDRHATIVPIFAQEDGIADLVAAAEIADADPDFFAAVTGDETLQQDFNELSQHDLKTGELQFGLPAALIVLL